MNLLNFKCYQPAVKNGFKELPVMNWVLWMVTAFLMFPSVHSSAENIAPFKPTAAKWVDAAFYHKQRKVSYFFQGDQYYRLTSVKVDNGYPIALPGGWRGLPANFNKGIDAAVYDHSTDKLYFLKGSQVVRITGVTVDGGYPKPIGSEWQGLPENFQKDIDAAIYRSGKIYFFKNAQYVRLSKRAVNVYTMDSGYPANMPGGWGLSGGFHNNLDAAIYFGPNGKNYFFKGDQYARLSDTKLDKGYPLSMPGGWQGLKASSAPNPPSVAKRSEEKINLPLHFWQYPNKEVKDIEITKEQLMEGLKTSSGDENFAADVTNNVFSGVGGAIGVAGFVGSLISAAPAATASTIVVAGGITTTTALGGTSVAIGSATIGASAGGAGGSAGALTGVLSAAAGPVGAGIGIAIALAQGTVAIIQKVRAENGTNLAILNTKPGLKVEIIDVSDFKCKLIDNEKGDLQDVSVVKGAVANCTDEHLGGIGLNLSPYRSGGKVYGNLKLKMTYKGKTYYATLTADNSIGAGITTKYTLRMDQVSPMVVETNRAEEISMRSTTLANAFDVHLTLQHADHSTQKNKKDQRKDVVTLFFTEVSPYQSAIVSLKNDRAGYRPKFDIEYTEPSGQTKTFSVEGNASPWNQDVKIFIKKGSTYKVTASTLRGKYIDQCSNRKGDAVVAVTGTITSPQISCNKNEVLNATKPNSSTKVVTLTFKNQAGFRPIFQVSGAASATITGKAAGWSTQKSFEIPKGKSLTITAKTSTGRSVSGKVTASGNKTITATGTIRNGKIE